MPKGESQKKRSRLAVILLSSGLWLLYFDLLTTMPGCDPTIGLPDAADDPDGSRIVDAAGPDGLAIVDAHAPDGQIFVDASAPDARSFADASAPDGRSFVDASPAPIVDSGPIVDSKAPTVDSSGSIPDSASTSGI